MRQLRALLVLALALVLSSCGAELEVETPAVPTIARTSPSTLEVLPPGWYLHLYPGLCVVLVRDADGFVRECLNSYPEPCVTPDPRACSRFPIGSR